MALMRPSADQFPVLLYHGIAAPGSVPPAGERKFWLSVSQWRQHLAVILRQPRRVATLAAAPSHSLVIAFDDGHASDYEYAFPALLEAGFFAEFFINPSTIGRPGFMTWSQVRELAQAGMRIESHGWAHEDHTCLTDFNLLARLIRAKLTIEHHTQREAAYFAAPYGFTDRRLEREALRAGYTGVCTSSNRWARPHQSVIPRVAMHAHTTAAGLTALLSGSARAVHVPVLRHCLVSIPGHAWFRLQALRASGKRGEPTAGPTPIKGAA